MSVKQEMEIELAFEILGALGAFIDSLSDEIISKVQGLPALIEKMNNNKPVFSSDIEKIIVNPVLLEFEEFIEIKEQISSKLCDNIKTKVEKHSSMQLLNEETLDDGSVLLTISV